jgi:succinate dehydrogenase / fumarate reductase cytochrome b subunit
VKARNRLDLETGKRPAAALTFDRVNVKRTLMAKPDKALTRPLSPFMQYRKGYTMTLSILHRLTGIALTVGLMLLVYWLLAAATGPAAYAQAQRFFSSVVVQVAMIGWIFSFCYHFLNGIRHLVWDTGHGFEKNIARASGRTVVVGSIVLAALIAFLFLRYGNGGAL